MWVSIIIPVYKTEKYLDRCVESVINQTYKDIEIILVDDGSPDACPQLCDWYCSVDSRIKTVHRKNGGLGMARNSGLDHASGCYVTFLDSDDWIAEDHIENLLFTALQNNADIVFGSHTSVDSNAMCVEHPVYLAQGLYIGDDIRKNVLLPLIGSTPTDKEDVKLSSSCCMNLYRRAIIEKNRIRFLSERVSVAEDMFFNIDYLVHTKRVFVEHSYGYFYFENNASLTRKYVPERFGRTLQFYQLMHERMCIHQIQGDTEYRIQRTFLMKIRVAIRLAVISDMPFMAKMQTIRQIINNDQVHTVLEDFPIENFVLGQRILARAMRCRMTMIVYVLMRLREMGREKPLMRDALRHIGIGKN